MTKPVIDLMPDENETYLIYLCESGVEYSAQTAEGVLMPLFNKHYALLNWEGAFGHTGT